MGGTSAVAGDADDDNDESAAGAVECLDESAAGAVECLDRGAGLGLLVGETGRVFGYAHWLVKLSLYFCRSMSDVETTGAALRSVF